MLARPSVLIMMFLLAGCQAAGDSRQSAGTPVSGVPVSCERTCNSEYDACMDRFSAIPGAQRMSRPDDPTSLEGPNGVCPDQLKSCLKRCAP